jgi:ankyrin repeat protein
VYNNQDEEIFMISLDDALERAKLSADDTGILSNYTYQMLVDQLSDSEKYEFTLSLIDLGIRTKLGSSVIVDDLFKAISKKATPISEYELDKEYGDLEDYESFEDEYEGELDYGGMSPEDFNHATVVLSLLGYDVSSMTPEDVARVVARKPKLLELQPKYDISGSWVHTIRQTDMNKLAKTAKEMANLGKEICVTDANEAPFWDFSEYRRFALVFNGVCKVLWNADVYSSSEDGQLSAVDKPIHHLDEMTEGWLIPSECELVGILCKDLKENEVDKFINVFKELGLDPNSDRTLQKTVSGLELIEFEEAQEYFDIPYDSGEIDIFNIENPEDLYESFQSGSVLDKLGQELINAAAKGALETVKLLLENGANVHAENDRALHLASINGYVKIVKMLLEAGANVHAENDAALREAFSRGHVEIVKLLLENGADVHADNDYALQWASRNGYVEVVKILLENGADIHADNDLALRWASSRGYVEVVKLLLENGADPHAEDDEALRRASSYGHVEVVKILLENGADVHADNDYALREASSRGYVEVVKILLENGANIHADDDYALRRASSYGHVEVVKLLLENGADVHADNDLALQWASENGHVEVINLLLESGADIHAGNDGALREASSRGYVEVVKLLLENGADVSVLTKEQQKEYAKYVPKKKAQTFKQQLSGLWTPDTWEEETPEDETTPSDSGQFYDWNKSEEPQEASLYDLYDLEKYKETLESAGIKVDRNGMVTFYQTNIPGVYSNQIPMKPIPMDKAVALLENNAKMVDNEQNRIKSLQDILSRLNSEFSGLDDSMQDVIANFDDVLALLEQFKYSEKSTNQDIAAIAEGLKTLRTFLSDSGPELSDLAYGIDQHADVIKDTQGKLDWYYQSQYEKSSDKNSLVEAMDVLMDVQQNDPAAFENLVKDMGGIAASFKRAFFRVAAPVSDYEISKEYGDIEDYESFEDEYEGELDYGGMSPEDFNHATVVLSLLGYDVSSMTPEDVARVVARKPKLLELQPKYDISGSWVHTIRQTDMNKLAKTAKEMANLGKEICVTDANEAPFWDFSEYRRFALVFNGTCKVLWNADVYSESSDGQLTAIDQPIRHLDRMTEGWLVPSECELVGILCKDLKENEVDNFINVFKELGLDPNSDRTLQKTISGFELIEFEEAQEYFDIPYDSGEIDIFNIENLEDLYESFQSGSVLDKLSQELINAAKNGDLENVKVLLENGADVHAENDDALLWASSNGHVEVVKLLLENGADPHAKNDAALRWASEYGRVEIVKLLLENGANPHAENDEALRGASSNGHTEVVQLLLENGANPHAENDEALRWASQNGHTEVVKLLLEAGANVHANDDAALRGASYRGQIEVVQLLLDAGADVSVLPKEQQKEYAKYVPKKKAQVFNRDFFLQKMSVYKNTDRLVTEEDIRLVHSYGAKNPDDFFSMYTDVLEQALRLGQLGYELGPVGHCSRYGKIPDSSRSYNYRDDYAEKGVSVISFEEDEAGSSGAKLFMSGRDIVEFDGILIEGAYGSDGENLVLPVNYYSLEDDLSGF